MSFLSLLAALVLGYYRPPAQPDWMRDFFGMCAAWLEQNFNDGQKHHGMLAWFAAVLLPAILIAAVYIALYRANAVLGALF